MDTTRRFWTLLSTWFLLLREVRRRLAGWSFAPCPATREAAAFLADTEAAYRAAAAALTEALLRRPPSVRPRPATPSFS